MVKTKSENIKLFGKWSYDVEIKDIGLSKHITLTPVLIPKTGGRHAKQQFYKSKLNIVERFLNRMFVAGHKGKKHKVTSGRNVGKTYRLLKTLREAFEIIEKKTKKNPIEILVRAIENSAPKEEVITYQKGGIVAREPVIVSPQRRVDLSLRLLVQGAYHKRHRNKNNASSVLANELILAYNNDPQCFAISEKNRREKEALSSR